MAHVNPAAAGRVAGRFLCAGGIIGAIDADLADVGEELVARQSAGFDGAAQEVLIEIVTRRVVGGEVCHDYGVRPGRRLEFGVECTVFAGTFFIPVEELHSLAVEKEFELLAGDLAEGAGVAHVAFADGSDLDGVLTIGGELMLYDHAAAGAEGRSEEHTSEL